MKCGTIVLVFGKIVKESASYKKTLKNVIFQVYYRSYNMHISFLGHKKNFSWVALIKVAIIAVPVYLVLSLLNHHFFLTSKLQYSYRPGHGTQVVAPKTLAQLLKTADPQLPWRIGVDNFLFTVTIPRLIESVRVHVRLDPGTQPFVALETSGPKAAATSKIISAVALDTLNWRHVSDGQITLWMRDKHISQKKVTQGAGKNSSETVTTTEQSVKQYDSLANFRSQPPNPNIVGLVGLDRMTFIAPPSAKTSGAISVVNHTLRGSHQLYVYAVTNNLSLSFDKVDLNRAVGTDGISVHVGRVADQKASQRTWIKTIKVGDDGVSGKSGPRGKAQAVKVDVLDIEPGLYIVDIVASDDILIEKLTSNQEYLSFSNRVVLAEGPAFAQPTFTPVSLLLNGETVVLSANHAQGKQDVQVAGQKVTVQDVKVNHTVNTLSGTTEVTIPKGDITVTTDGLLAFAGSALLPKGSDIADVSIPTPDFSKYDYIVADYQPRLVGGILEVDQTYAMNDLPLQGKTITFSIQSPGLQASSATLGLHDIRVTLERGPFPWDKIWKKLGLKKS